ncbi:glycolipid anchored surface protein GAS1 [Aureobasidium melanogenum CBS 110374]|uniref:1,3-beta-glucanosyltransferase n=1 Tax=Aureobasidium melanogenum (strain CBS 110374) TaxID=1043003 RepID=A0A074VSM8_AURM1|nr:glycolipid anchored surface protein GAS1 [Aureobasidium melanogenum CBS 110374]KEQ63463.1 glycolipid anchored surface protein GAS1 [Aureobasidium melanogenum CBS 110374]
MKLGSTSLITNKFFVRGVVYYPKDNRHNPIFNDPIADDCISMLEQNVVLFKELGINTLYIYSVDNTKQHDKAMKLLQEAGIYVVVGVSTPSCCINRSDPYESYNTANVSYFLKTAGVMAGYANTLGIVATYHMAGFRDSLHAFPVLKAVIRDLKRFLLASHKSKGTRVLPVGYSQPTAVHIKRSEFLEYLYLGDQESAIDFLAASYRLKRLPNYGWAGIKSNMQMSGWNALIDRYENFAIPAFLSEYGVNTYQPRQFLETSALYSDPMTRVFSGGCVYDFTDTPNNFGLVAMPGADKERWFQNFRGNEKKVNEVRQTDQGNLYIYHDFVNYKKALAEPTGYDPSWDIMESQAVERHNIDTTQMTWPWDPRYQMPATCIDWDSIEEVVRR